MANSLLGLLCPVLLLLSSCQGLQHQICHDLTDYGKLYFTKVKVNVCNVTVESKCKERTVSKCIQVPGVRCRAELFTECERRRKEEEVVVSRPVLDTKSLPWCQRVEVVEERLQTSYKCENLTRQHCTSLWKIVNGEKVWAGNDECREITWQDCKPHTVSVNWMVPRMNCTPEVFPFLTFENQTSSLETEERTCRAESRAVCENVRTTACGFINITSCSQVPVVHCSEVLVPVPAKDKIHQQWCLFDSQHQAQPGLQEVPRPRSDLDYLSVFGDYQDDLEGSGDIEVTEEDNERGAREMEAFFPNLEIEDQLILSDESFTSFERRRRTNL